MCTKLFIDIVNYYDFGIFPQTQVKYRESVILLTFFLFAEICFSAIISEYGICLKCQTSSMSDREPTRWQHNRIYPHPISPCVYTYVSRLYCCETVDAHCSNIIKS